MREDISALMDGELSGAGLGRAVEALKHDPDLSDAWSSYHLIGDALRRQIGPAFGVASRVQERLEAEPTVIARLVPPQQTKPGRIALPLAASVAGVGVVAWLALSLNQDLPSVRVVATTEPAVQAAVLPVPVSQSTSKPVEPAFALLPEKGIQEYLIAHQGYSPSNSIQGIEPYMRTVTDERLAVKQ